MKRLKRANDSEFIKKQLYDFEQFYFIAITNLNSAIEAISYACDKAYGSKSHNDPHWKHIDNLKKARELLRESYRELNKINDDY